ncbi:MAG TPA: MFS transporter [Fimbriimonas sp.]|nr:MFS transporter [Fimbriimonas sp.]
MAIDVDEAVPTTEYLRGAESGFSKFRWTICALIFFATTINYMDRQLFSLLVPFFEDDLKLGPTDLALINVCFIVPYGLIMIFVGQYVDRVGIKKGLARMFTLWNLASMAHALVRNLAGFCGIRLLLGVGESGMFPSAIKTMTEWFPRKERSFATGLFNAGANAGAILAPLLGVALAQAYGWRTCFLVTGGAGMIWLIFWNRDYRPPAEHPRVSPAELRYIQSDPDEHQDPISYRQLFGIKQMYGLGIAKALTDAPWWFYLTWMPKFLVDQFHLSVGFMALAIPVIYIISDIGSVAGGWCSSKLIHAGYSVGKARKLTMLICALAVLPVMGVGLLVDVPTFAGIASVYWAVGIVALAAGAHQGWSCNLFTLVSDTVPKGSVAVAVGAINGFAMVGVSALQFFVGWTVQVTNSYTLPFIVAGSLYLIGLAVIQLFMPEVKPVAPTRQARMSLVLAGAIVVLAFLAALQYTANRPPYASLADYEATRGKELHASPAGIEGPKASVGWMQAQWFLWKPDGEPAKTELVKFDTHGHPFIEPKGIKASKYKGPTPEQVSASFKS